MSSQVDMMNSGLRTTSWLYEQEYLKSWGGVFFVFAKLGVRSYKFQSNEPSVNWKCDKVLPKLPVLTVSSSEVLLKWLRSQTVIRSFFPLMFLFPLCLFFIPVVERKPQSWGSRSHISAAFSGLLLRTQCMAAVLPANQNPLLHLYLPDMARSCCMLL